MASDNRPGDRRDDQLIATSVDEYLISLANSINHAQRYISSLYIAGRAGQPSITYQLPRVDFELKLLFQVSRTHPPSGASQRNIARSEGGAFLEARPLGIDAGDPDSDLAEAASTIKGSFVAVPVHGGTPPPVVTTSWTSTDGDNQKVYTITVTVRSSLGEPVAGQEAQFNIDRDLARALNAVLSGELDLAKVLPHTTLAKGVELTDASGNARNDLTIGDLGLRVPVVIDILGTTQTLVFTAGAPAVA